VKGEEDWRRRRNNMMKRSKEPLQPEDSRSNLKKKSITK